MKPSDFTKASLQQLMVILRFEDCELPFKCFAESEIDRRMKVNEIPTIRHA